MILLSLFLTVSIALVAKPIFKFVSSKLKKENIPKEVLTEVAKKVEPYQLQEIQTVLATPADIVDVSSEVESVDDVVSTPVKSRKRKASVKKDKAVKKKSTKKRVYKKNKSAVDISK